MFIKRLPKQNPLQSVFASVRPGNCQRNCQNRFGTQPNRDSPHGRKAEKKNQGITANLGASECVCA
jgi:hypothetical protein